MMENNRCPRCGIGELLEIAFDADPLQPGQHQGPSSHQVETYSCGHEVIGPALEEADIDRLEVERRTSSEGVSPPRPERGSGDRDQPSYRAKDRDESKDTSSTDAEG
jgi:hypothetical protein